MPEPLSKYFFVCCCTCESLFDTSNNATPGSTVENEDNAIWVIPGCSHVICDGCYGNARASSLTILVCKDCEKENKAKSRKVVRNLGAIRIFLSETIAPPSDVFRRHQHELDQAQARNNRVRTEAAEMIAEWEVLKSKLADAARKLETFVKEHTPVPDDLSM
ncbi:hypothetical protein FRC07_006793 [Ceratobasidium sp. 392]|nr:hypothetical protein FRC07_006793 [Ceratobasidium sp. 392]